MFSCLLLGFFPLLIASGFGKVVKSSISLITWGKVEFTLSLSLCARFKSSDQPFLYPVRFAPLQSHKSGENKNTRKQLQAQWQQPTVNSPRKTHVVFGLVPISLFAGFKMLREHFQSRRFHRDFWCPSPFGPILS